MTSSMCKLLTLIHLKVSLFLFEWMNAYMRKRVKAKKNTRKMLQKKCENMKTRKTTTREQRAHAQEKNEK